MMSMNRPQYQVTKIRVSEEAERLGYEDFGSEKMKFLYTDRETRSTLLYKKALKQLEEQLQRQPEVTRFSFPFVSYIENPFEKRQDVLSIEFVQYRFAYRAHDHRFPSLWAGFVYMSREQTPSFIHTRMTPAMAHSHSAISTEEDADQAIFLLSKDMNAALENLTSAIQINRELAHVYVMRGDILDTLEMYDAAIQDYSEALKLDPQLTVAWYNRAATYMSRGMYESVIADCSKALELDPAHILALANRGAAYNATGKFRSALSDLNSVIRLNPYNYRAVYNRAAIYRALGQLQKAKQDYQTYLSLGGGRIDGDQSKVEEVISELTQRLASNQYTEINPIYDVELNLTSSTGIRTRRFTRQDIYSLARQHRLHILEELHQHNYCADSMNGETYETQIGETLGSPIVCIVSRICGTTKDSVICEAVLCLPKEAAAYRSEWQKPN